MNKQVRMTRRVPGSSLLWLGLLLAFVCCQGLFGQRPELLYLRFNAGVGTTVGNQAVPGFANTPNVTLQGGATWDTTDPKFGNACLDTRSPVGFVPLCSTNVLTSYSGDWTIETWVKKTGAGNSGFVLGGLTGGPRVREVPAWGIGNLALSASGFPIAIAKGIIATPGWRHIAFVFDSPAMTITPYVDGVPQPSTTLSGIVDITGDGANGLAVGGFSTASWPGLIDEFRIWNRALSEAEILAGMTGQTTAATIDVGVTKITSPVRVAHTFSPFSTSETVSVVVGNLGTTVLPAGIAITLSYSFPGASPVSESLVLTASLSLNETLPFTFSTPADMSGVSVTRLDVTATFLGDLVAVNDTRTRHYRGIGAHVYDQFPHLETFDLAPTVGKISVADWLQDANDGPYQFADWWFVDGVGLGSGAPSADHTTGITGQGFFASPANVSLLGDIRLLSPLFDLQSNANPRLEFWMYSENGDIFNFPDNTLSVDVIEHPFGNLTLDVHGPIGSLPVGGQFTFDWVRQVVDLSAFSGKVIELRFRVNTMPGQASHVIGLDDVEVSNHPIGPGQAPRPGLALFDINQARSVGGELVSTLENGPYSAFATPGGPLDFSFSGEAGQPILLLFGPINPLAATFPSAGQMDIGGVPDPTTGIPVGVALMFDGTLTTGLNPLFQTNVNGISGIQFITPMITPGILTTFQAAIYNSITGIALSNAVQLEIQ